VEEISISSDEVVASKLFSTSMALEVVSNSWPSSGSVLNPNFLWMGMTGSVLSVLINDGTGETKLRLF